MRLLRSLTPPHSAAFSIDFQKILTTLTWCYHKRFKQWSIFGFLLVLSSFPPLLLRLGFWLLCLLLLWASIFFNVGKAHTNTNKQTHKHQHTERRYRKTAISLQRMESVSRSPIFSHFQQTLSGITTIRAYGVKALFKKDNEYRLNRNNELW